MSNTSTDQKKKPAVPSSNQLWNIIDTMATKIALTNDDTVLEKYITQYLPQLLSLIAFPDTTIRNKVLEVLTHINKRIKQVDTIKLPFDKILELFMNATDEKNGAMTRNFSVIYLDMAFDRLSSSQKADYIPQLFEGLSTKLPSQQDVLLRILLEAIPHVKVPTYGEQSEEREKFIAKYSIMKTNHSDRKLLLTYLRDYMLFRQNYRITGDQLDIPAGLSIQDIHRIVGPVREGKQSPALQHVYEKKLSIVDFVYNSQLFEDEDIYQIILVGSLDGHQSLTNKCENAIKKLTLDYSNVDFVNELIGLYLGHASGLNNRTPASDPMKVKILNVLSKSREAVKSSFTRHLLMDSLFTEFGNPRVKSAGMQFFIWVLSEGQSEHITYSSELFTKLVETLERFQRTSDRSNDSEIMKENFYTALGSLARKFPEFVRERFHLIKLYFHGLEIESPQVKISVQQGLSSLIQAYTPVSVEMQQEFEQLFLSIVTATQKRDSHAISAALRSTNRLFPFDHAPSRFMCLLCSDDAKLNVREESARGLDLERFTKYRQMDSPNQTYHFGEFDTLIEYLYQFFQMKSQLELSVLMTPTVLLNILQFCRQNFESSAKSFKNGSDYIQSLSEHVISQYIYIIHYCFTYTGEIPADLLYEGSESLLHLLTLDLSRFGKPFADQFHLILEKSVFSGDDRSRERVSKLLALLTLYLSDDLKQSLVQTLRLIVFVPPQQQKERETHAAVLLLGDIIAITFRRDGMNPYADISDEIISRIQKFKDLENIYVSRPLIMVACYRAVGEMGRQNALQNSTLESLIPTLLNDLKRNKGADKIVEIIIQTISMIVTGENGENLFDSILQALFTLGTSVKSDELFFTIGECMAAMTGGSKFCNLYQNDPYSVIFEEQEEKIDRNQVMTQVLTKIIKEGVLHPSKIARQCASIWLMSILRYCRSHPRLKMHLKEVQRAFSILLTDTNEITNEVAGRGLAYVYELSDVSLQNDLVNSLVDQLSGTEQRMDKKNFKLTEDTEMTIFPESVKESRGSGGGTYKELVDVANDIGKPEMIYQMLAVSSHNAIWNAKRAAAFSAVHLVNHTQNNEKLEKMLPTIIPKLYRYQFDPNPVIQKSMTDMWRALVKNPKQMIDQYLHAIVREILNGVNSNLWRVREASCYALTDIYTGRRFLELEPFIEESCLKVFRVMDDIKESGRKAANTAIKKISAFCVKCCDPKYTDAHDVRRALGIIVPIFLKEGLLFPLKDVVYLSLEQLHQIANVSGVYIRPYVTDIVGTLLEQSSVLEPQMLNYIQMNQEQYGVSTEQLENLRLSMVRSGPIADTISQCERRIDEEVMVTLVPRVMDILRSGTGFATRSSAARFVQQLAKFHGVLIRKHTQVMLRTIMNVITNSSGSSGERTILASALPYVLKNSKISQAEKVLQQVVDMYVNEAANENSRLISGLLFEQMIRQAPVIIQKFYEKVLPIVFIARHDPEEKVRKTFQEQVWDEIVSHSSTIDFIRLFLKPIANQCLTLLSHSSWQMKKQGGQALKEIAESIPDDIPVDERTKIGNLLIENIPGRIWDGKWVLLDAFGALLKPVKNVIELKVDPVSLLTKESRRTHTVYRNHALAALRMVASSPAYNRTIDDQKYAELREMVEFIINEPVVKDEEGDEQEQLIKKQKEKEQVKVRLMELQPYLFNSESPNREQYLRALREDILTQLESRHSPAYEIALLHNIERYAELKPLDKQMMLTVLKNCDSGERPANIREVALILLADVLSKKRYEEITVEELRTALTGIKEREKDKKLQERVSSVLNRL